MADQEKKKILLIDDDTSLLMTLSDFLRFEGYHIVTADCGENGLKVLETMTPDLIILDMSMPGMGGIGFLRAISPAGGKPQHPVLVLTARANMAEFFANVDVAGFIAKPCDPNDLLMEVARIIFLTSGAAEEETTASREMKKIIVGEDDDLVREQLVETFAHNGYLVDSIAKGPEMLEKAIVQRPHLIIMKRVLASMNGDAVATMLREMPNTKEIPILLYDDTASNVNASKYTVGNVKKFIKSSDPDAILKAARTIIGE